jgi:tetratricopeptide (TPR) repeat protein
MFPSRREKQVTALPPALLGSATQRHAERGSIPTTAWADLNARGREYLLAGDSTRAIECFAKATETNPSYASAWNNHGAFPNRPVFKTTLRRSLSRPVTSFCHFELLFNSSCSYCRIGVKIQGSYPRGGVQLPARH